MSPRCISWRTLRGGEVELSTALANLNSLAVASLSYISHLLDTPLDSDICITRDLTSTLHIRQRLPVQLPLLLLLVIIITIIFFSWAPNRNTRRYEPLLLPKRIRPPHPALNDRLGRNDALGVEVEQVCAGIPVDAANPGVSEEIMK